MRRDARFYTQIFWRLAFVVFLLAPIGLFANGNHEPLGLAQENSLPNCTEMFVDISTACLVPCTNGDYFVRYCNFGDETAVNALVVVEFDSTFQINGASLPFTSQTGNVLVFDLGNVPPDGCGSFSINVTLDCDVTLGQAHCVDAQIFPSEICSPPSADWDGSNVEVEIECHGDSIYFNLENTGNGDMGQPSQFIIIEDDLVVMVSSYYLPSGDGTTIVLPNNGGFYHFEAGQSTSNPNGFFASTSTEGCDVISTGYLTQYPEDDMLLAYEETCILNDTTCHFNTKLAFPVGLGALHEIGANTPIQYQINFQNTSSDTVHTVVVCDTLSSFLDTSTLIGGASTYGYTIENLGNNVFKFTFADLDLPPGGFGFVKFQVNQMPDNPACGRIENWARIYLDQDSLLTDTVFHTISCGDVIINTDTVTFCNGGGYYGGVFYSQSGFVSNTANFSTFTSTLNTTINVYPGTPDETIYATICEGQTYQYNGQSFNTSGTYTIPMIDGNGCPYSVILILTVEENDEEISYVGICSGEQVEFHGQNLMMSGTYSHVEPSGNCFKIEILVLTVHPVYNGTFNAAICQGEALEWEGEFFTMDTTITHHYQSQFGCDSSSTLALTVHPNHEITLDMAICQGDTINGHFTAGSFTDTLQSVAGCDSIVTINLEILPQSETALAAVICEGESYSVGGISYTVSGIYVTTLLAANGCDSIVTLQLIVQAKDSLCFANAGLDTLTCGYQWNLEGYPSPGTWEALCNVSTGFVAFDSITDSTALATVSECGTYFFKYTHVHFDTLVVFDSLLMAFDSIIDTCTVSDIVQVDFEDPSLLLQSTSINMGLDYNDYTCHEGDAVSCSNVYLFDETAPLPLWKFDMQSTCNSTLYSTTIDSIIEDCLAADISVIQTTSQYSYSVPSLCSGQGIFLELDSNTHEVISNTFLELLDSLVAIGQDSLQGQCLSVPNGCFPPPPCVPELLGYDTSYLKIPVHLGGQWTYIDQMGQNVPLNDSTIVVINNHEYELIVTPNAHTYSPVEFELWRIVQDSILLAPTSPVTITLQWQELWTTDSIQIISPIFAPLPDSCSAKCLRGNLSSVNYGSIPEPPPFSCPPLTITFEGQVLTLNDSIVCDSNSYTVQITISGGTPPYTLMGLAGSFVSTNVFVSEPLPYNLGYQAWVTDAEGCDGSITGESCRCLLYAANSVPEIERNCIDSCVVLNGFLGGIGGNWTVGWWDQQGMISTNTSVTVCELGTYVFKVIDQGSGCVDSSETVVYAELPLAEAGPAMTISCSQNSVVLLGDELTGDAAIVFSWVGPGINSSNHSLQQPQVSEPGNYGLTVTNTVTGCTDIDSVMVMVNDSLPNAVISPPGPLNCFNPSLTLNGNNSTPLGQLIFQWTTLNGGTIDGQYSPFAQIDEAGVYTLMVTNPSNGCTNTEQVTVVADLIPPQMVDAGTSPPLDCDHEMQILQGSVVGGTNLSYSWTTNNGNIVSGENTLTPTVDAPGVYKLIIQNDVNGCIAEDEVAITADFNYPIAVIAAADTLNCIDTLLSLNGQSSSSGPDITYHWVTTNGEIIMGENSPASIVDAPGTYYLTVNNTANGCEATDTVQVFENKQVPDADAGLADHFSCNTDSLRLDGTESSMGPSISYQWTTNTGSITSGHDTQTPWAESPGTYFLLVTDESNGCSMNDTVLIEDYEPVAFDIETTPACQGTDIGSVLAVNLQGQATSYYFKLDNGQVQSDSLFIALPAGGHTLTVLDQDSCAVDLDFLIDEVQPLPTLNLKKTHHTCGTYDSLVFNVSVGMNAQWVHYSWSNGDTSAAISPKEDGEYSVTISTPCEQAIYEFEVVDDLEQASYFEMPNAFSPNNDGMNDTFGPVTFSEMEEYELVIFNRWGERIFNTNDLGLPWDGTYKGKQVASDVYIYKVFATYKDCIGSPYKLSTKGDVTLLR